MAPETEGKALPGACAVSPAQVTSQPERPSALSDRVSASLNLLLGGSEAALLSVD